MTTKWNGYALICDTEATAGLGATANRNDYQPTYSNEISIIPDSALELLYCKFQTTPNTNI
jgi:hypothetical protein